MSRLEEEFVFIAGVYGLQVEAREYRFADEVGRKFRFDFAWPDPSEMVAVECDGGIYSGGRHVRPKGYEMDCEKLNLATELGWRVFRFTANALRSNPFRCIEQVKAALAGSSGESLRLANGTRTGTEAISTGTEAV